jgi:hypothetical protein
MSPSEGLAKMSRPSGVLAAHCTELAQGRKAQTALRREVPRTVTGQSSAICGCGHLLQYAVAYNLPAISRSASRGEAVAYYDRQMRNQQRCSRNDLDDCKNVHNSLS